MSSVEPSVRPASEEKSGQAASKWREAIADSGGILGAAALTKATESVGFPIDASVTRRMT